MKLKIKILLIVLILLILNCSMSFAESAEGKTIRLESYSGSISVLTGAGKELKIMNKMRIFDGYTVVTAKDSTAYLSIDNMKSIKLDQNTKISIIKKNNINEIQVVNGSIFFSILEKLKADESLDIVTPTMSMGIRGTIGLVEVNKNKSLVQLYSGKVTVKNNRGEEKIIDPGEKIKESDIKENELKIEKIDTKGKDIPSFCLTEINKNPEVREEVKENQIFEIEKFAEAEKENKIREELEKKKQEEQIEVVKAQIEAEKKVNKIDRTEEKIEVIKEEISGQDKSDEKFVSEDLFTYVEKGEKEEIENLEGKIYIFEVDEETGTATFVDAMETSTGLEIENSSEGIKINIEEDSKKIGDSNDKGGYVIFD